MPASSCAHSAAAAGNHIMHVAHALSRLRLRPEEGARCARQQGALLGGRPAAGQPATSRRNAATSEAGAARYPRICPGAQWATAHARGWPLLPMPALLCPAALCTPPGPRIALPSTLSASPPRRPRRSPASQGSTNCSTRHHLGQPRRGLAQHSLPRPGCAAMGPAAAPRIVGCQRGHRLPPQPAAHGEGTVMPPAGALI